MILQNIKFKKIFTDRTLNGNILNDKIQIPLIIEESLSIHRSNVADMLIFDKFYYNSLDTVTKVQTRETQIDYRVPFNEPYIVVNYLVPYCVKNPPKYILRKGTQDKEGVQLKSFCDMQDDDNYPKKILDVTFNSAMYRVGYILTIPTIEKERKNGRFFKTVNVDPKTSFVVYDNKIEHNPILGVIYFSKKIYDKNGDEKNVTQFNVWTKWHKWEFILDDSLNYNIWSNNIFYIGNIIPNAKSLEAYPLSIDSNGIMQEMELPLVEYQFKTDGTNAFESALPLIMMMSTILSLSVDACNERLDYVLKFTDVDLGDWIDVIDKQGKSTGEIHNPTLEKIKMALKYKMIEIKSNQNATRQPDVTVLDIPFNHNEVQTLLDYVQSKIKEILFLPQYNIKSGGQATGAGANAINGSNATFNMAGTILTNIIEADGRTLDVKLETAKSFKECPFKDLTALNIEIKAMLNKDENLIVQTQSFSTMVASGVNRQTAYVVSGLVADPSETVEMDKLENDNNFQIRVNQMIEEIKQKQKIGTKQNKINTETNIINETKGTIPISNRIIELSNK